MISRRGLLKAGGAIFGGLVVLGGIASETDLIDDPDDGDINQANEDTPDQNGGNTEEQQENPSTVVQGEAHSREHWRFEIEEGEHIEIGVEVIERPEYGEEASVELETVAEGTVAEWTFPFSDVEQTFDYTAEVSAEHTLKVYNVGIAEVEVVLYGG